MSEPTPLPPAGAPTRAPRGLAPLRLALPLLLAVGLAACDATNTADLSADATTADLAAGGSDGSRGGDVFATANPAGVANDAVVRLSSGLDLEATYDGFTGITSVQNVTLNERGAGFVSVDLSPPMTGGILVIDTLCTQGRRGRGDRDLDGGRGGCRGSGGAVGAGSRLIAGPATGLVAPKGLLLARGSIIVADNGAPGALRVFAQNATGNAAPQFVVTNTGGANVWDVAYDNSNDRLFVAATNGTVLVYDRFFRTRGASGPTRTITPSDGAGLKISVNLHGIDFDARTRILVLSDVGIANGMPPSATDGQLFTIANGDRASGNVAVRYRNDNDQLGNPVDLVLSGRDVYVAEKANSLVLFYSNILARTGTDAAAANDATAVVNAESVALSAGYGGGHGGRD